MGRPLLKGKYGQFTPDIDGFAGEQLTVAIYWKPRGGDGAFKNGHAALIIDLDAWFAAQNPSAASLLTGWAVDKEWYVSWLGGQIDWSPKLGSKGGHKGIASSFGDDAERWGSTLAAPGDYLYKHCCWPEKWVALKGLNIQAMHDEWKDQKEKGGGAHWRLTDKNCATMVHKILKAGGGNTAATGHKHQLVWWPTDIPKYARSMTQGGVTVFDESGLAGVGAAD